ncbi:hypothetical protein Zmor_014244 [Zophobas morio]|uniref:Uncharacterized protein n=1 Tax=Zophobas morio TaxID=2755281 RepID=A0AA38MFZ9_9CUCU|nr:hypothetical protein Zmor_014244 [Zophobas morio]
MSDYGKATHRWLCMSKCWLRERSLSLLGHVATFEYVTDFCELTVCDRRWFTPVACYRENDPVSEPLIYFYKHISLRVRLGVPISVKDLPCLNEEI